MEEPHATTVWTARACATLWLISLGISARNGREGSARRTWLIVWMLAGGVLCVHVLAAFHFEHHWSHSAAWLHTARQTDATVGLNWGGGLYLNYLVVVVWLADILFLFQRSGSRHEAAPKPRQTARGFVDWFVAFMMINATVVFGPWGWKPLGAIFFVGLLFLFRRRIRLARNNDR